MAKGKARKAARRSEIEDRGRIYIEAIEPSVDGGRYRSKTIVNEPMTVSADVLRDGHDMMRAVVKYAPVGSRKWRQAEMTYDAMADRWTGVITPDSLGVWKYTVEAWTDKFGTWARDLQKRAEAGQDLDVELEVGALMVVAFTKSADKTVKALMRDAVIAMRAKVDHEATHDARLIAALAPELLAAMRESDPRTDAKAHEPALEVVVERELARTGAWYELFPRSTGAPGEHGTFLTTAERLPHIASMGFDVVYLPPIHPIGFAFRKGRNNTLTPEPGDVGSPWAIGSKSGGHDAVHPDLGTLDDFDAFMRKAKEQNLEVALDFAVQCSPDHPWVKKHPKWFAHRPDGTIRYAENPPKKYQDIYPIDFDTTDRDGLWTALRDVMRFWIDRGVKIFRVDNPHTKSFAFWEWAIETLRQEDPELIFLAEAFTRPKVMATLAKLGFTQSYTYFTWRNTRSEIESYMRELATERAAYFRPNFFANTPDILHEYLQRGGAAAFRIRLVLAATLSPTYGLYSGYELFENAPVRAGSEEYLDSEKYELRPRPLEAPGSLVPMIRQINMIRDEHPALERLENIVFHSSDKEGIIAYSKRHGDDCVLVVCSLNPYSVEESTVWLDMNALGVSSGRPFQVRDLLGEQSYLWHGGANYVRLTPDQPAHIFEVKQG